MNSKNTAAKRINGYANTSTSTLSNINSISSSSQTLTTNIYPPITLGPNSYVGTITAQDMETSNTPKEQPIKIHTINNIQDVYIDSEGFIVATIQNNDIEFHKFEDGWPLYMGFEEWAFLVKSETKITGDKAIGNYITIRSKNPIYKGQHFAILNQQDTTHHTNEEIINAVNRYSRLISWESSYNPWDNLKVELNGYNAKLTDTSYLAPNPTRSLSTVPITYSTTTSSYDYEDSCIRYKDSEVATLDDIDTRLHAVLDVVYDVNDRLTDTENLVKCHDGIIADLSK